MNDLQIFSNPEFGQVRTVELDGQPWLVGKDVAEALGYKNPRDAITRHVDAEDKGVVKHDTPSGEQEMLIINESGLYSLVLSSKLPKAKAFKRWVTSEVLPARRRVGAVERPGRRAVPQGRVHQKMGEFPRQREARHPEQHLPAGL